MVLVLQFQNIEYAHAWLFSVLLFESLTGSAGFFSSVVSFAVVLRVAEVAPELERWSVE